MSASRTFEFTDPYCYQSAVRAANAELFLSRRGEFRGGLILIDLNRLWMQRGSESLPGFSHAAAPNGRAAIEFLTGANHPAYQYNGVAVRPGEIVINDLHLGHRRWSTPHSWGAMSLRPTDLAMAGSTIAGKDLTIPAAGKVVRPSPELMRRLLALHAWAARLAREAPDTLKHPEVTRSLEQALVHTMILVWSDSISVEPSPAIRLHSRIMTRLEDFLAAHSNQPLYLGEICTAIGVSERTLRNCSQEQLGVSPSRYLWLRRMHFARRALLRADPAVASVTEIAINHGFAELGRFAVRYRELFGESPSVSLRRPAGEHGKKFYPISLGVSGSA